MSYYDYDDYDDYDYDDYDYEAEEERRYQERRQKIKAMTPEQLGKEWSYECRRHDSAVDRCEEINSPTIESAAGWMRIIQNEFKDRGLDYFDYTAGDTD